MDENTTPAEGTTEEAAVPTEEVTTEAPATEGEAAAE